MDRFIDISHQWGLLLITVFNQFEDFTIIKKCPVHPAVRPNPFLYHAGKCIIELKY